MARNITALASSLQSLLAPSIAQASPDSFQIFYSNLAIDIARCIDSIDEAITMHAHSPRQSQTPFSLHTPFFNRAPRPPSRTHSPQRSSSPSRGPSSLTSPIKVMRIGQVTVYSNKIGSYDIYISRPKQKSIEGPYPGLVRGGSKIFKRGVKFFQIQEQPLNSNHFVIEESKSYLSLVQSSDSYVTNLSALWEVPKTPSEINRALRLYGYDPEITQILDRPRADLSELKKTVLVEDFGEALNDLDIAKKIPDPALTDIADAILAAGSRNPPALIPFDTKLENILCIQTGPEEFKFRCVDFTEPGSTLDFIPDYILPILGLSPGMPPQLKGNTFSSIYRAVTQPENLAKPFNEKATHLTYLQAAYVIAAEEIISTFLCLLCGGEGAIANFMSENRSIWGSLENHEAILQQKEGLIEFLESDPADGGLNLANLFIRNRELSAQISRGLATEKACIKERKSEGRKWIQMLITCYFKRSH